MCFSAEADLVAGVVVTGLGIDAVRHADRRRELPLAALPLLLGAHQFIEAFVWWGLDGDVAYRLGRVAIWAYLVIALVVLPLYAAPAVGAVEPKDRRRRMALFGALGVAVAAIMVAGMAGGVSAEIEGRHVRYGVDIWQADLTVLLYVAATCGPFLAAGQRRLVWFGAANLLGVAVIAWIDETAVVSLWCLWAALASGAIVANLRLDRGADHTPRVAI
ncbi:MAG: hypothetical protein HKN26_15440 [Acidimicrobiales bacterium]|nr:hypothetical protein [Acidimicrobiales bacterium]